MARPYSLDLRERVVAAVESGRTVRDVASSFGVSVSSVVKWSQRYRATGSAAALPMGGRRPFALAAHRGWVLSRLAEKPDLECRPVTRPLPSRSKPGAFGHNPSGLGHNSPRGQSRHSRLVQVEVFAGALDPL